MQVQSAAAVVAVRETVAFVSEKPARVGGVQKKAKATEVLLNRVNLKSLIEGQNGLFVSVTYVKANGETRVLTGRLGVKAYLKGGLNNVERDERPYLTMFDVQLCQYRTVNLASVSAMRSNGKVYTITG